MDVNGTDYTFALLTGLVTVPFGHSRDCNGERHMQSCPHYGSATINTRGTGLRIDLTVRISLYTYVYLDKIKSSNRF